jgi:adenine phosphoribosyltransferase
VTVGPSAGTDPLAVVRAGVRDVPDFPQPGILFRDITPLLRDGSAFRTTVEHWATLLPSGADYIVGAEARGFILGAPLALELGIGFVPARKAGKLPPATRSVSYDLEYGSAALEIAEHSIAAGDRVIVIDDLLATGGTARATCDLVQGAGAEVLSLSFLLELSDLGGRARLGDLPVHAVLTL